jgi:hypothetical protein
MRSRLNVVIFEGLFASLSLPLQLDEKIGTVCVLIYGMGPCSPIGTFWRDYISQLCS